MSQEVAKTILSQLGGQGRLVAMLGASSFSAGEFKEGEGVSFRIKAKARNKAKAIVITLNPRDLYDVRFVAMRGFDAVDVDKLEDIYCDMLQSEIEDKLGLALSF